MDDDSNWHLQRKSRVVFLYWKLLNFKITTMSCAWICASSEGAKVQSLSGALIVIFADSSHFCVRPGVCLDLFRQCFHLQLVFAQIKLLQFAGWDHNGLD